MRELAEEQLDLNLDIGALQKARDQWDRKIKDYEQSFDKWIKRCEKIVDRYRDERKEGDASARMRHLNIFWSNVQTLAPAVYSKPPKIEVTRRYFDKDPIGRIASAILERAVTYEMDITDFDSAVLKCREDYLICGRGTLWQRYEPIIEGPQDEEDDSDTFDLSGQDGGTVQPGVEAIGANGGPPLEQRVIGENAPTDYVHWKDFLHGPAQNWKQVPWIARRILMDKGSVDKRWPDPINGKKVSSLLSFTHKQEKDDEKSTRQSIQKGNLALIYECWNKIDFTVSWYSPDLKTQLIETVPDPLELNDFFPTPEPLFATMTTDRLIPRPDYSLYEDQAIEVDVLTQRIALLIKALAVRGVYDGSNTKLADLLNERPENFMLAVDNWAAFAEKGGLQGQMSFVPIDQIIKVVQGLQAARQVAIQDIYSVTGISDIVRGNSDPNETAAAQNIKGNFANLRLNNRRDAVAKFLRGALRLMSEVICNHFDESTLRKISGFDQMPEVVNAPQGGQNPDQLWSSAYAMLKSDPMRLTHLDIETNSMVEADLMEQQKEATEFLQAVGGYLDKAVEVGRTVPMLVPLIGQMLSFGVRRFKIGRELEAAIDAAMDKLTQMAANPPPAPPNPEVIKAQAEAAKMQAEADHLKAGDAFNVMQLKENTQLAREELMLKYGINPFIEAALAEKTQDPDNDNAQVA